MKEFKTRWLPIAFFCSLLQFSTGSIFAQDFTKSYFFSSKNNHFIPLPVSDGSDEYVMAGTLGNFDRAIRFMHVDNVGNVLKSVFYIEADHNKACFDFTDLGNETYLITCLRRGKVTGGDKDRIELITVDKDGTILDDDLIESAVSNRNMYPIHTLLLNGYYYICGYSCNGTSSPNTPTYNSSKTGFILQYDPSLNSVLNCKEFNSNNSATTPSTDYDIAIRAVPMSNGDIYVTGGCNIVRPLYNPVTLPTGWTNSHVFTCGTITFELTPSLGPIYIEPIAFPYGNEYYAEYGQSMVETGGYYYNVGNYFEALPFSGQGFTPAPTFFHFTAQSPSTLLPAATYLGTTPDRWQFTGFDFAWGLQTLPSVTGGDVVLAGMLNNHDPSCGLSIMPSYDNYNPFIADYNLSFGAGGISVSQNYWKTYLNQSGTGKKTAPNSYHAINGWLYNNAWSCNLATRRTPGSSNDALALTAPKWNSTDQELNFKFIQGTNVGDIPNCHDSYNDCMPSGFNTYQVKAALVSNAVGATPQYIYFGLTIPNASTLVSSGYNDMYDLDAQVLDCENDGVFRQSPPEIEKNLISVFPNPVQEKIYVKLAGYQGDEMLQATISDISGKTISYLFHGTINDFEKGIELKDIANGTYLLQLNVNGLNLKPEKIIVNK